MNLRQRLRSEIIARYREIRVLARQADEAIIREKERPDRTGSQISQNLQTQHEQLENQTSEQLMRLEQQIEELKLVGGLSTAPWTDIRWLNWEPGTINLQHSLRIGTAHIGNLVAPAMMQIAGNPRGNLLVRFSPSKREQAIRGIRACILRLACTSNVRFLMVDPLALGQSFVDFGQYKSILLEDTPLTDRNEIAKGIANIRDEIARRIQQIGVSYRSFEDFLSQAQKPALNPYYFVTIADFPEKFDQQTVLDLASIARQGPEKGVFLIVLIDKEKEIPQAIERYLDTIDEYSTTVFQLDDGSFSFSEHFHEECRFVWDTPPRRKLIGQILDRANEFAQQSAEIQISFRDMLPDEVWSETSIDGLRVPIGVTNNEQLHWLELGDRPVHALVAGTSGMGKTNLLHNLIINMIHRYSYKELEIYLVDSKHGVEFKPYASKAPPHLKAVSIRTESEFGASILQYLLEQISIRGKQFREIDTPSIRSYREATGNPLPRILLIIDEVQTFFAEDNRLSREIARDILQIATTARGFGVHMVLATQSPSNAQPIRNAFRQFGLRIAFKCEENDSRIILAESNPGAYLLEGQGTAIYNDQAGVPRHNTIVQVAYVAEDERAYYIEELLNKTLVPPGNPYILDGDLVPTLLETIDARQMAKFGQKQHSNPLIWLGEPLRLARSTEISLDKLPGKNISVIGGSVNTVYQLIVNIALSTVLQQPNASIFIINATPSHIDDHDVFTSALRRLRQTETIRNQGEDISDSLRMIQEEIEKRQKPGGNASNQPPMLLFVIGLQGDMRFRKEGFNLSEPMSTLLNICDRGPMVGIHTTVWSDTFPSINAVLDWNKYNDLFRFRIGLQMDRDNSLRYLNSQDASELGPTRSLLFSVQENRYELFRPYQVNYQNFNEQLVTTIGNEEKAI